jgi:hypothetical protein
MASTRNKNTIGNYALETRENVDFLDTMLYKNSAYGSQEQTYLPGDGITASRIPNTKMATNAVDIETFLRGTRATDLVHPNAPEFIPDYCDLKSLNMYAKPTVIMPLPLTIDKNQRPIH